VFHFALARDALLQAWTRPYLASIS
jgi:hypothetical protein